MSIMVNLLRKRTSKVLGPNQAFSPYTCCKVKPKILREVSQNNATSKGEGSKDTEASKEKPTENENVGKEVEPTLVQEQQHKVAALNNFTCLPLQSSFTNNGLTAKPVKRV
jgi:hypothetical protein